MGDFESLFLSVIFWKRDSDFLKIIDIFPFNNSLAFWSMKLNWKVLILWKIKVFTFKITSLSFSTKHKKRTQVLAEICHNVRMFRNKWELWGGHVFRNKPSGLMIPFCSTEETSKKPLWLERKLAIFYLVYHSAFYLSLNVFMKKLLGQLAFLPNCPSSLRGHATENPNKANLVQPLPPFTKESLFHTSSSSRRAAKFASLHRTYPQCFIAAQYWWPASLGN